MENFVELSVVAREELGMKPEACGRYLRGEAPGWPNLGTDLQWTISEVDGRDVLYIHKRDVDTFVQRVINHMNGDA